MRLTIFSFLILIPLIHFSCSEAEPESFKAGIIQLNEQNEYEEALAKLKKSDNNPEEVHRLKVRTHLAYASYLTHEADHLAMGERMSDALRHYRRVLELDENNTQAITHIELIEGIYDQMGRDIPQGVAE